METKTTFRQSTIERLSSPEQLDQLMKVTTPVGWAALIAIFLLLGVAVIWGFTSRIPVKVYGQGILIAPGGINTIVALAGGQIEDIYFDVGDVVRVGTVIARIREPGELVGTRVISPFAGQIIEIQASVDGLIERGDSVMAIESSNNGEINNLEAILYLSPAEGKQIEPGMDVEIAPSTVRREEYGYMLGKVTSVGVFPATFQGMLRVLGNENLVDVLSTSGAPIEVRVDLQVDTNTPSGYRWSSTRGPSLQIDSGTLCDAWITIRLEKPVNWLFNASR